jgi:hypothetical protein
MVFAPFACLGEYLQAPTNLKIKLYFITSESAVLPNYQFKPNSRLSKLIDAESI